MWLSRQLEAGVAAAAYLSSFSAKGTADIKQGLEDKATGIRAEKNLCACFWDVFAPKGSVFSGQRRAVPLQWKSWGCIQRKTRCSVAFVRAEGSGINDSFADSKGKGRR